MQQKYWWWIGGGAVAMVGIGSGAYLLTRARTNAAPSPTAPSSTAGLTNSQAVSTFTSSTQSAASTMPSTQATATVQLGTTAVTVSGSLVNYLVEFQTPSTVAAGSKFTITLVALKNIRVGSNVDNVPMAGQSIAIAIGSSSQTVTTNSQGQATLVANAPTQTGTAIITAAWQPAGTSQPTYATATITIVATTQQAACGPKFVATFPASSPSSSFYAGFVQSLQSSNPLGLASTYPGCTVRFWFATYINNASQTFTEIVGLIGVSNSTQARAVLEDSGWNNITQMVPVSVDGQTSWTLKG